MAIAISVDFPGIEIIDDTSPTSIVSPYGVGIIVGSASKGPSKVETLITSLEQFDTLFGNDSGSRKYVRSYFANLLNSSVRLYFYRVNTGSTAGSDLVAAVAADYITAFSTGLDIDFNPGGIVICPEFFEAFATTGGSDVTARANLGAAMKAFCDFQNGSLWMGIPDIRAGVANISDAVAEAAASFASATRGELFTYFPHYRNSDNTLLLPSAARMALTLSIWASGQYFKIPAGSKYPIKDAASLEQVIAKSERSIGHAGNVNVIRLFDNFGYAPDDSLTLSKSKQYYHINSVVCFRIVGYLLERETENYIHEEIAGNADLLIRVEATANRVCRDALASRYLVGTVGGNEEVRAFMVTANIETLPDPSNSALVLVVELRPAYSLQKIVFYLRNTLGQ